MPPSSDPHRRNASRMLGIPEDLVTKEQRHIGKVFNCAAAFGAFNPYESRMSVEKIAELAGIDVSTAETMIALYHERVLGLTKGEDPNV